MAYMPTFAARTLRSVCCAVGILALVYALSRFAEAAQDVNKALVFVGVLRLDGLLIPTATYDGTDWWDAWPFSDESDETVTSLSLPTSLNRIPHDWLPPGVTLPVRWRAQLAPRGNRMVRLVRPARPKGMTLTAMVAIETDYPTRPDPDGMIDSEAGVAVAGAAELGRFAPASDAESRSLLSAILPLLHRAETEAIAERIALDWKGRSYSFPANEAERARRPFMHADFLQAERRESGRTFQYFTGWKDYGSKPYPNCDVTVDFEAIVIRERDGRIASPSVSAYTTFECSRDNHINLVMAPLATLHWSGPVLWVIRHDAEDGFYYSLMNPAATDPSAQIQMKGLWHYRERKQ